MAPDPRTVRTDSRGRASFLTFVLILIAGVCVARLGYWQVVARDQLLEAAAAQLRSNSISPCPSRSLPSTPGADTRSSRRWATLQASSPRPRPHEAAAENSEWVAERAHASLPFASKVAPPTSLPLSSLHLSSPTSQTLCTGRVHIRVADGDTGSPSAL